MLQRRASLPHVQRPGPQSCLLTGPAAAGVQEGVLPRGCGEKLQMEGAS